MLGTTPAAVDSALRRARTHLAAAGPVEDDLAEPDENGPAPPARRLRRRVHPGRPRMPWSTCCAPTSRWRCRRSPTWFTGRSAVVGFLAARVLRREGQWRMRPGRANGQPAFVVHQRADDGGFEPYGVHVLTLVGRRIARITAFNDPGLVSTFAAGPVLDRNGGA